MEILALNTLIEFMSDTPDIGNASNGKEVAPAVERILYFDNENDWIFTIDIFSENSLPVLRYRSELMLALENSKARVLENDPFNTSFLPEENIPAKHREIRDKAYESIALIIESEGCKQFFSAERGKLINESFEKTGVTKMTIYKNLRRFWKLGMRKNSLLPKYENCGTNNEWRSEAAGHKKLGRPSLLSKRTGKNSSITITPTVKQKFERGINKFYRRQGKTSLRWTYRRIIATFFHNGFTIKNSVPIPVIPPSEELPSYRQFHYWYEITYPNRKKEQTKRLGRLEAEMNHRALLGDSTAMASGPGAVYQVDATKGDIYLVSEFDRSRIIGRPVIYFVIDVFSRYVVGIAVTLEGPSWLGAMLALDNVVCDKVAFCAEHNIEIEPHEWNSSKLPVSLLGDRGEFEGYAVEPLVNNLGIRIQNAPPFRADFKGIVERAFGKANEKFIHFLPGAVSREKRRGQPDYRLDAVLTLKEFRSLLICYVLSYNAGNELTHYNPDEFQITDKVDLYPQELWDWGIKNRSGHLRSFPQDIVRLNLLPRKKVSVTQFGIHFGHDLYYTCDLAKEEAWFERARERSSWKIEVAYDPRNSNNIYIPLDNGRKIVSCHLTQASEAFKSRNLYDIEDYFHSKTERREENRTRNLQSEAQFHALSAQITKEAKRKTKIAKAAAGQQSNRAQVEHINDYRRAEKEIERSLEFFNLDDQNGLPNIPDASPVISAADDDDDEGYVAAESKIQQIREITRNK